MFPRPTPRPAAFAAGVASARGGDRAHDSASRDQALRGWFPSIGSADADQEYDRNLSRTRARDLDRNDSMATSYLNEYAKLLAPGVGLLPNPRPDYIALGWTKAKSDAFAAKLKRFAHGYMLSPKFDASRHGGIGQFQRLSARSRALSGGVLILPIWKEDPRYRYSTCFHLVVYDRLSNPLQGTDQRLIRNGVEVDPYGEPLAYHVAKSHQYGWDQIPATTDWGRARDIHPY